MLTFVDLFFSAEHGLICSSCFQHEWKYIWNKSRSVISNDPNSVFLRNISRGILGTMSFV